jgi:hypothetical protein
MVCPIFLNFTDNGLRLIRSIIHNVRVHVACIQIDWNVSVPCINLIKSTCVRHHFSNLYVMLPLAFICIHSKSTVLLAMHIIYLRRDLHCLELFVQSQGGPASFSTRVYGAHNNLIICVLPGHIITMTYSTMWEIVWFYQSQGTWFSNFSQSSSEESSSNACSSSSNSLSYCVDG